MNFLFHPFRKRRRGRAFTLTELAIVLGVIGTLIGGIWAATGGAYNAARQDQAQKDLLAMVQNVRAMYATRGTFPVGSSGADYTTTFMSDNIFPSDMIIAGSTSPQDPWGDNVSIQSDEGIGGASPQTNRFEIIFWGTSNNTCYPFLTQATTPAAISNGLTFAYADVSGGYGDGTQSGPSGPQATAALSTVNESTFQNCTGNLVLQYTLQ